MSDSNEKVGDSTKKEQDPLLAMVEPCGEDGAPDYAGDGEEASPMSPGMRRMKEESDEGFTTRSDRVCNVIALALLFIIMITAVISIAAGACLLASLQGKPFHRFPLFYAFGVTPVVLGCVALVLSVAIVIFIACCAMGLGRYGMCCYGTTRRRGCARVCLLGVFPFFVFIVLLAMCILGFTFYSLSQQLPPLDKNYTEVAGLSGPVSIARDEYGLPHIKASSRRDAYFGQGFAAAQDRLFQLEFHRLVSNGNLSSAVGKDGNTPDIGMRTLNVRDSGAQLCESATKENMEFLEAYVDGINHYLKHCSKRPVEFFFMSQKALYFRDPEPFTPVHLCQTMRLFQYQMSSNSKVEGSRFKVWAGTSRTYEEVEELFPDFTGEPDTILNEDQSNAIITELQKDTAMAPIIAKANAAKTNSPTIEKGAYNQLLSVVRTKLFGKSSDKAAAKTRDIASMRENITDSLDNVVRNRFYQPEQDVTRSRVFANKYVDASNAWAARDATGKVVVASDPHLTINLPSIWYWVHLSFPTENQVQYDAAGVSLLGIPGVHIGRTSHLAWGITMSKTDVEDLFIFPNSFSGLPADSYYYDGELRVFKNRRERIHVKGKKDIVLEVKDTLAGPIVSSMLGFPESLPVALYAVYLRGHDNESMSAIINTTNPEIDTAEKMMHNLIGLQAPGFSIPIGDVHGNIAYAVTGRHPNRPIGHTGKYPTVFFDTYNIVKDLSTFLQGGGNMADAMQKLPAIIGSHASWKTYISSTPETAADDFIPHLANPHVHLPFDPAAPASAYLSAANQKIVPDSYPFYLGNEYSVAWRGWRLHEMLKAATDLSSYETHRAIQMDHQSNIWVKDFQPFVQRSDFLAGIQGNADAVYWRDRLLAWDGQAAIDNVEAAFFWRWVQRLCTIPKDAIEAAGLERWDPANGYLRRMFPADPTTTISPTVAKHCAEAIKDNGSSNPCLAFAVQEFLTQTNDKGRDFDQKWGRDLNRMTGLHEMLEKKIVAPVFQRTMNKGGDFTSLAVSTNTPDGDMPSTHASSVRMIYDLWSDDNKDYMYLMFPGGASGNPYSPYYQNLWELFEQEVFVKVSCTAASLAKMETSHYQELSQ